MVEKSARNRITKQFHTPPMIALQNNQFSPPLTITLKFGPHSRLVRGFNKIDTHTAEPVHLTRYLNLMHNILSKKPFLVRKND